MLYGLLLNWGAFLLASGSLISIIIDVVERIPSTEFMKKGIP